MPLGPLFDDEEKNLLAPPPKKVLVTFVDSSKIAEFHLHPNHFYLHPYQFYLHPHPKNASKFCALLYIRIMRGWLGRIQHQYLRN